MQFKRAHLSTEVVLAAAYAYGTKCTDALSVTYPDKVVLAAIDREVAAGHLDYGSTPWRPWLTDRGRMKIQEIVT